MPSPFNPHALIIPARGAPVRAVDACEAAALALVLRRAIERPGETRSEPREAAEPWSAAAYLGMARAHPAYSRLTREDQFVLGLLTIRADDAGQVRFARRNLLRLYGIEPGDIDDAPLIRALDCLRDSGWVRVGARRGRANIYALALPPQSRIRRVRL